MNVLCSDLITMVPKWNYLIFMQIDYPRWPPGTVTKSSINTKMSISQDPWLKLIQLLAKCFLYESVIFFAVWYSKMAVVTQISTEHEK